MALNCRFISVKKPRFFQVEWPETIRTHVLMPLEHAYNSVEEVEEYFKAKVPFPVEIATSISDLIDEVWERVKDHDAILSQAIKPITEGPSQTKDTSCKHIHLIFPHIFIIIIIIIIIYTTTSGTAQGHTLGGHIPESI